MAGEVILCDPMILNDTRIPLLVERIFESVEIERKLDSNPPKAANIDCVV